MCFGDVYIFLVMILVPDPMLGKWDQKFYCSYKSICSVTPLLVSVNSECNDLDFDLIFFLLKPRGTCIPVGRLHIEDI